MKLETFFEKFELFAEAPDAVARMREVVLELAVRGKLTRSEAPWRKQTLKSLSTKIGSGATPAGGRNSYYDEGTPLIRSMNVHFGGFERTGLVFLNKAQANKLSNVIVQAEDVLLNITGASIGRVTTAPNDMAGARVNQHVTIIRPTLELSPRFLTIFLASPSTQRMINEIQVGATRQALTKAMIEQFEIFLPPLAEQKRIAAKVDELMALCDQLEAQQQHREARHAALVQASLARFTQDPTPANLQFLFHPSYTVSPADLRKTILTLAVQGKLVPQDPNDEPANNLLKEIESERLRMVKEGRLKKFKPILPLKTDELPFELPQGWEWVRILDISQLITSGSRDWAKYYSDSGAIFITMGNLSRGNYQLRMDTIRYVAPPADGEGSRTKLEENDLLISITGDVGNLGLIPANFGEAYINQHTCLLRFMPNCRSRYFPEVMRSPLAKEQFDAPQRGIKNSFRLGDVGEMTLPLPPLAEQHRIVAKVDELMALVDELESQLTASRTVGQNLMAALVQELTTSP